MTAGRALEQVATGVHVATAGSFTTTSPFVVADDGACLLVDPALTPAELAGLARAAHDRGWRVAAGVSTHPHWDHLLWAAALGPAPRFATPAAAREADRRGPELPAEAARDLPGHEWQTIGGVTPLPGPADPARRTVPWPGPEVVVVEHSAHAPGHAALLVTGAGVLLAGDMLSDTEVPLLDLAAADPVGEYRRGLETLAGLLGDARRVVPGHGHVTDATGARARIDRDRRYLDSLEHGGGDDDPRLTNDWIRGEHARQRAHVAPRGGNQGTDQGPP
ncbi:MBL fold metallo-hydrolase [Georgenia sp. AZ-5]|uniref:MBL fold metallo-hydrolase n=1 Tax=Georgenia sp. AZ-5 TaxID=3367526 RepID=UPI00375434B5